MGAHAGDAQSASRRVRLSRASATSQLPSAPVDSAGRTALLVVLALLGLGAVWAIRTLVAPLLLGACVAAMVRPTMLRLQRRMPGPKHAAAAVTALVVLVLALPLVAVAIPTIAEAHTLLDLLRAGKLSQITFFLSPHPGEGPHTFREFARELGPRIAEALPGVFSAASELALGVFVFLMTLYYALVDGERSMRLVRRVSPLAHTHLDALVKEFVEVGRGVILSVGLTALVQGGVAGIAFFSLGLPSAALLSLLTAVAALVPIGTILVWGPVAAVLYAQGRTGAAAVIVFTGIVVISGIDHFVRPQLTRLARTRLHPLLVFLGMFGGLASLGAWGLFAGPLVIALGVAALRLYDRDQRARARALTTHLVSTPAADARAEEAAPPGGTIAGVSPIRGD